MQAGFIYVITNTLTGDQYVGLTTKTVAHRWSEHKTAAVIGKRTHLYAALRKYGPEAYVVQEFISVLNKENLPTIEQQAIQDLRPRYNQTNGGEVTFGRKYDDATKERIRQGSLGKKRTPEQKAVQRQISKARWDNDPVFREHALAALEKGRKYIDRDKQRKAAGNAAKNREWTDASRAKLSASCMGRVYGSEIIEKMRTTKRKAVKCNETGVVYTCRDEAAKATGVSARTIFRDARNEQRNPAKGRVTFSYI